MLEFRLRDSGQTYPNFSRFWSYPSIVKKSGSDKRIVVSVRRSPRLSAFITGSALIGFLLTLTVTSFYEADPSVGFAAVFAYFALFGVSGSVSIGLVGWLLLDRLSKKRLARVTLKRESNN